MLPLMSTYLNLTNATKNIGLLIVIFIALFEFNNNKNDKIRNTNRIHSIFRRPNFNQSAQNFLGYSSPKIKVPLRRIPSKKTAFLRRISAQKPYKRPAILQSLLECVTVNILTSLIQFLSFGSKAEALTQKKNMPNSVIF